MSPGGQEIAIFDERKERLWQSYILYSEKIPELYDYFEDIVYSPDSEGQKIIDFMKDNKISFPSRADVNSGKFLESLSSEYIEKLISQIEDYLIRVE